MAGERSSNRAILFQLSIFDILSMPRDVDCRNMTIRTSSTHVDFSDAVATDVDTAPNFGRPNAARQTFEGCVSNCVMVKSLDHMCGGPSSMRFSPRLDPVCGAECLKPVQKTTAQLWKRLARGCAFSMKDKAQRAAVGQTISVAVSVAVDRCETETISEKYGGR